MNADQTWIEYTVKGPVDTVLCRTTPDVSIVQWWSEHRVPGLARQGWNTTKSATVAMTARKVVKTGSTVVDRVLVEFICGMPIRPQFAYLAVDLVAA